MGYRTEVIQRKDGDWQVILVIGDLQFNIDDPFEDTKQGYDDAEAHAEMFEIELDNLMEEDCYP